MGAFVLAAATMLGSNACGKASVPADDTQTAGGSESDSGTTTATESDSTESTQGDTSDSASDTNDTNLSFSSGPDNGPPPGGGVSECDPFAQDCPEGEKCIPYASSGFGWDRNKCVPITGNGEPGDPCISSGIVEGTDDCGEKSHCWNVMDVDGMPVGVCTEFCQGTPDDPICPVQTSCLVTNEGAVTLCIQTCDPLLQDCGVGLACFWTLSDFNCVYTTQETPLGEPCGYINDCAAGTGCLAAEVLPDCAGAACCGSFCSLIDPMCPQVGTECIDFFELGQAPPGYEDIGTCIIPGA